MVVPSLNLFLSLCSLPPRPPHTCIPEGDLAFGVSHTYHYFFVGFAAAAAGPPPGFQPRPPKKEQQQAQPPTAQLQQLQLAHKARDALREPPTPAAADISFFYDQELDEQQRRNGKR